MVDQGKIEQDFTDAGWKTDGSFLNHLAVGNLGDVSILAHWSTQRTNQPTYELYDVERHVSCWVHKVPTPEQAEMLLEEHGETPKEE